MKIEIDKPVVPKFVADWIEKEKKSITFHKSFSRYLGNKDIGVGTFIPRPYWLFDNNHLQVERMTKEKYKGLYGLDETTVDFEEV